MGVASDGTVTGLRDPNDFERQLPDLLRDGIQPCLLPFVVYLPAAVMIRFIPTFMDDVRMVRAALRMKGIDARFWLAHPLEGARMALMPVLFRALRSSENLGLAAEMKGVTGRLTPKPRPPVSGETRTTRRAAFLATVVTVVVWLTLGDWMAPEVAMPG